MAADAGRATLPRPTPRRLPSRVQRPQGRRRFSDHPSRRRDCAAPARLGARRHDLCPRPRAPDDERWELRPRRRMDISDRCRYPRGDDEGAVMKGMRILHEIDVNYKDPDYGALFNVRMANYKRIQEHPELVEPLKAYYRENELDFITDWGVTFEPRNVEIGKSSIIPLVLYPKQRDLLEFVLQKWRERRPGLIEKSRDIGATWGTVALSCTLCIFNQGMAIGFGSRTVDYVDKIGTMKPIFPKARMFMEHLPEEFRAGWVPWRDAPYMRLTFPETGSIIGGEGGDQIGRGDRTGIYFVDEAAPLLQPPMVQLARPPTTNCR